MRYFSLATPAALFLMACCCLEAYGAEEVLLETKQVRITNLDFEVYVARIPAESRAEVLASKPRIRSLLENLLVSKTLAAQARSAGLERDPAVAKEIEQADDRVLALARSNAAVAALTIPNFEKRASELYKVNIENYTRPAQVHASHILVDTKTRKPEEALKRAEEVRTLALAGKPFETLVEEYSDDPSAKQNKGDLGFFESGRMVKPFSDAAFAMQRRGEISAVVKTSFGYHIIQFHEMKPKQVRPYAEVKAELLKELHDKYIAEYRKKLVSDVLADPTIKLNEAAVDRFHTKLDFGNAEAPK